MSHFIEFSQEAVSDIDFLHKADRRLFERIVNKIADKEIRSVRLTVIKPH